MIVHDFNMAQPAPRRNAKRVETLITLCALEAVARCYMYKQASQMSSARRWTTTGLPKKFDFGDLWDPIRTMQTPSRELILCAWVAGLEYTVGTSMHGVSVMTAVCQRAGISIGGVLLRSPRAHGRGDRASSPCRARPPSG